MDISKSTDSFDGVRITYDAQPLRSRQISPAGDFALVFVHGWSCNRSHWLEQVAAFSDRYRVIAIDLAGHGDSGLGRTEYSMESFALDVKAVLDIEQIRRAVLVGHSMGGMVILHAARMLGERVVGLVGADTFKYLREDPRVGKQAAQWQELVDDYESAIASTVSNMFTDSSPDVLRRSITDGMVSIPREVAIGAMKGMADDAPLFDVAVSLNIPKLTINATGRQMDESAASDAGIKIRHMPSTGHFVMNEDPVEFNRLLDEALERIPTGQA
ncbi:MAG: alpha/beta hydrolase [Chloroflexi bacterium]|nr:alpha/beta hydrolase [Chloroflexota bacterium]